MIVLTVERQWEFFLNRFLKNQSACEKQKPFYTKLIPKDLTVLH